jgi:antitoxin (DNA-binding transcriptional repressor) of toxin-antitoxin stability system
MTLTVNVHEAMTHFSRLPEQAQPGGEIILATAGKPYARLVPLAPNPEHRQPGRLAGRLSDAFFEPLPEGELAAWEMATFSTRTLW